MRLLYLCPKLDGYQSKIGSDVSITAMSSGRPRRRRAQIGATHTASVSFTLNSIEYDYIMAFWRLTRAEPFGCQGVVTGAAMRWHVCRWSGVPTISNSGGGTFTFSAKVIIGDKSVAGARNTDGLINVGIPKKVSHLYPLLIEDNDGYTPSVIPLDITLREVLKERFFDNEAYIPSVTPLDITIVSLKEKEQFVDNEAYIPSVTPLDITLKNLLRRKDIDGDAYAPSVKPLDITLKRVLITHVIGDKDGYTPSVKPLDITLRRV